MKKKAIHIIFTLLGIVSLFLLEEKWLSIVTGLTTLKVLCLKELIFFVYGLFVLLYFVASLCYFFQLLMVYPSFYLFILNNKTNIAQFCLLVLLVAFVFPIVLYFTSFLLMSEYFVYIYQTGLLNHNVLMIDGSERPLDFNDLWINAMKGGENVNPPKDPFGKSPDDQIIGIYFNENEGPSICMRLAKALELDKIGEPFKTGIKIAKWTKKIPDVICYPELPKDK